MGKDRIVIEERTFTGDTLLSGNCFIGNSIAGDELAIDTLNITVDSPAENLSGIPYGTAAYYYHGETLMGKFYVKDVKRVGKTAYSISCVSGVGLLEAADKHYGGLYTGETAAAVLSDIVGDIVPYTVSPGVGSVRVYGWLGIGSRRDALRQVLFAVGAALKKDTAGEIYVTLLNLSEPSEISDDRLMAGGSVEYQAAVSGAVVLEHGYLSTPSDEAVTLYDDSVTGQDLVSPKGITMVGILVSFDAPVHDLASVGGTILESGVNYAVLAPGGQTTLTGKKYTHTTRAVYLMASGDTVATNVARVEDATLVNVTNSEAVAARVADYYSMSRRIKTGMVVGAERPGDAVSFNDPYDDPATGLLMSQAINLSNTLVAQAEFVAGYIPTHEGVYEHSVILTGSGTWTVPNGVKKIRVVLIDPGNGGNGGMDGGVGKGYSLIVTSAEQAKGGSWSHAPEEPGEGGDPGAGGLGGKILQMTFDVTPGRVIPYSAPDGGLGGEKSGGGGQAPVSHTTFAGYSAADGSVYAHGYTDIITGETFAVQGPPGTKGRKGGKGGNAGLNVADQGERGEDLPPWTGGLGAVGWHWEGYLWTSSTGTNGPAYKRRSGGGGGSGAAYGENGKSNGKQPGSYAIVYGSPGPSAVDADASTVIGAGGPGGHGGGGAGSPGGSFFTCGATPPDHSDPSGIWIDPPDAPGGLGSKGGQGGPGGIIVYY